MVQYDVLEPVSKQIVRKNMCLVDYFLNFADNPCENVGIHYSLNDKISNAELIYNRYQL